MKGSINLIAVRRKAGTGVAFKLKLLLSTAALLAPFAPEGAHAQAAAAAAAPEIEEVVVTGTRIVREGYEAPTPLSVIGTAQLESAALPNIAQYITSLPAFVGSTTTRGSLTNGVPSQFGTNSVNLRGLGAGRTLTLVDGHRVPAILPSGLADISSIPQQLISRVDVVTGGASAVYGSDAITGVVNFVLDKTFTGVKADLSAGITNYGDGRNGKLTITAGTPFASGRGHFLISGEMVDDGGIRNSGIGGKYGKDRAWTNLGAINFLNPAYGTGTGQSTSVPQRLIMTGVGYATASPGGLIYTGPLKGTAFGQGGVPYQMTYGDIVGDPYMHGGDWAQNDIRPWSTIAPSEKRQNVFSRLSYEVADNVTVYAQSTWLRSKANGDCCSIFMPSTAGPLITPDNAFLPDAVRARMVATGVTNFRLGTVNQDLDVSIQNTDRISITHIVGVNGDFDKFGSTWRWDISAQRGITNDWLNFANNISRANYTRATDAVRTATGTIVCRSTLTDPGNGCSPWNPLGIGVNIVDGPGWNYVHRPSRNHIKFKEDVYAGSITGEPFSDWAGPVSVAASVEHREDKASAVVDAVSAAADHIYGNYTPIAGKTHVSEGALETVVPLAKDQSWAESWNLNAAVRYTDYSLAGSVATWKIGTTYSPISDIRLRATRSRDIRAPNIQEMFQPASTARNFVFDPFTNTTPSFSQITVGNTALKPEKADTLGLGMVVQPSFFPGFSISADYWAIKLNDAIANVGTANVLNLCFDKTRPDLCQFIVRDAAGVLVSVTSGNVNLSFNRVRGIDFEASYVLQLSDVSASLPGSLRFHANYTRYLEDYSVSPITAAVNNNGTIGSPKWRQTSSVTYDVDPFSFNVSARGFAGGKINSTYITCTSGCPVATTLAPTANINFEPGRTYWDASIQYRFSIGDDRRSTAYFNIRNIGNKDPGMPQFGNTFGNGTEGSPYDVDGTVFRIGLRFQM